MTTLYSSVIKLINLAPVNIPPPGGQHAHGAFFHIIEQVDPALSKALHEIEGKGARKPFTVSPVWGLPKTGLKSGQQPENARTDVYLREGWECWLRVTILDDGLFKSFIEYFMNPTLSASPFQSPTGRRELPQIRLGDAHFSVSEILSTPGSHPWAGYISIEELQKRLDEPAPRRFSFEFFSPTQFGYKDDWKITLPLPRFVFGSLASAWRMLTGDDNVRAIEKYAEENLLFGNYDLYTQDAVIENKKHPGGVGKVEYLLTDKGDSIPARALNALADLAFYSGLGRKTTQGMGMTRRV